MVTLFDYFWKPNGLFSQFCYVFWRTTSYTVIIVLRKMLMEPVNALARWWPCACLKSVSGQRRLAKTLNILSCIHVSDRVLKCGSDINEGKWLQLFFCFYVLVGIVTAVIGMSFFSAVFHVLDWSFVLLHFDGNVCNWIPKVIWPRMDWFWVFFGKWLLSSTSCLCGLKSATIAHLFFFFDDISFFQFLVWRAFWCVL